jgi:oligopeptide transport system substrate-binding protein
MTKQVGYIFAAFISLLCLAACDDSAWNAPQAEENYVQNVRYGSFASSPKTLDPAESYVVNESLFLAQIYEPPLQYHYLKRPFTLIPLVTEGMPLVRYWGAKNEQLPEDVEGDLVAYTTYDITIKPNILYQPHPAFARNARGEFVYHDLTAKDLEDIDELEDFTQTGSRELVAEDYVYQVKRLAHPKVISPILGLMGRYIQGLADYPKVLREAYNAKQEGENFFDLRKYRLEGAEVIDKYTYRITLQGKYQQFEYWLAMPFFAPVPWEVDAFYSQPGMEERNLTLKWQPVGTGPYFLAENNPNKEMVLQKNPNFHPEYYPTEGMPGDAENGYLLDAGKRLPFTDKYVFTLEKEVIPRWNKFLQGYYDQSAISSDNFGEAIQLNKAGKPELTEYLKDKGIRLQTAVDLSAYYFGFNMLDDLVGGDSERARKLRQAIGIVLNQTEFIEIFLNGRGVAGQGPLPPGIFGYVSPAEGGMNPYIYHEVDGIVERKPISAAKKLLAEAGYPDGRDQKTGEPVLIRFDTTATSPADQDRFVWIRKQFEKIGLELDVETTDVNRFQEKMRNGSTQFFMYGWLADYPDPENFLFLFYGPNGQVKYQGINGVNYANEEYDILFKKMQQMPNNEQRFAIIQQMLAILQHDAPWVGQMFTETFLLSQQWIQPNKLNPVANNSLKYQRMNPQQRIQMIQQWNSPVLWPIGLIILIGMLLILPAFIGYYRKMHRAVKR